MEHFSQQKILIATAGFGDGHNSAAHNLAKAFESTAEAEVIDPCAIGAPFTNNQIRKFYRFITTHTPHLLGALPDGDQGHRAPQPRRRLHPRQRGHRRVHRPRTRVRKHGQAGGNIPNH